MAYRSHYSVGEGEQRTRTLQIAALHKSAAALGARKSRQGRAAMTYEAIAAAALFHADVLLAEWLPGGRKVGQEWVIGPLQNEPGDSCKTNLLSGRGSDFA